MKTENELINKTELNNNSEVLILPIIIVENKSQWIVKNNFPEADFWLINKGNKDKLGEPVNWTLDKKLDLMKLTSDRKN